MGGRLIMSTEAYETLVKQIGACTLDSPYDHSVRMDLFEIYLFTNKIALTEYHKLAMKLKADTRGDCSESFMDQLDVGGGLHPYICGCSRRRGTACQSCASCQEQPATGRDLQAHHESGQSGSRRLLSYKSLAAV